VIQESTYIRVWLWLLALLGASLVVGLLGAPHIAVAMIFAVAAIKALLVLGNFMHLRWEPKLVWAIVGFAAFCLIALFFGVMPDLLLVTPQLAK
jgi:caa(3)-type oxidase subunit IV